MAENKLTLQELTKALECCKPDNEEGCLNCPLDKYSLPECAERLSKESIALINRQQAEIEEMHKRVMRLDSEREEWSRSATAEKLKNIELQAEIERLEKELSTATNHITRLENQIERLLPMLKTKRAEAIKEFAEKLKEGFNSLEYRAKTPRKTIRIEELQEQMDWVLHTVSIEKIDDLVKEMVGDE